MIESLTSEQQAKVEEYRNMYLAKGLSTTPCDRTKAEAALTSYYLYQKLPAPNFIWADSPFEGRKIAARILAGREEVSGAEIQAQASLASQGSFDAYWVSFYAFIADQLPVIKDNLIEIVKDITDHCGVYWMFENTAVMTEKPCAIHMQDKKLHNPSGLALEYKDSSGIFAIEGEIHASLISLTISIAAKEKS